jgi:hypothetical protein
MASEHEIRVGMNVRLRFGPHDDMPGLVKEDRGNFGVGGRRIFSIAFELYPGDQSIIELPADRLQIEHQIRK